MKKILIVLLGAELIGASLLAVFALKVTLGDQKCVVDEGKPKDPAPCYHYVVIPEKEHDVYFSNNVFNDNGMMVFKLKGGTNLSIAGGKYHVVPYDPPVCVWEEN